MKVSLKTESKDDKVFCYCSSSHLFYTFLLRVLARNVYRPYTQTIVYLKISVPSRSKEL